MVSGELTIFIVDDDDAIRESLALLLESAGYAAQAFSSGTTFLSNLRSSAEGCLLIDVQMPEMDGLEVQQELNRRGVALRVIVMTGHADVPLAVRAMKAGAFDFIEKPFADEAMLASVARALALVNEARDEQAETLTIRDRAALLTAREHEVLNQLVAGHPNKVIAFHLSISPRTVEIYRARVMEKMKARSLSELVRMTLRARLSPATMD